MARLTGIEAHPATRGKERRCPYCRPPPGPGSGPRVSCHRSSAFGVGKGSLAWPAPLACFFGRIWIFAVSERSRDPPPCRRYLFTRSRKLSASLRRYASSCSAEQNLPPFSRTSRGKGSPHQEHPPFPAPCLRPVPDAAPSPSVSWRPSTFCRARARSACSRQQNPPCIRSTSSGDSAPQ